MRFRGLAFPILWVCALAHPSPATAGCDIGWSGVSAVPAIGGRVHAFEVFDDGTGEALYAGGSFSSAGAVAALNVARWDGSAWSALGAGVDGTVYALEVHDDGSGPALFVGGDFTNAGVVAASRVARWDGAAWSALGTGVDGSYPYVDALHSFDDGTGSALYAGGFFTIAGGSSAYYLARWNGTSWSTLAGDGRLSGPVYTLATFDDGNGPGLYVGGYTSLIPNYPRGGSPFYEYIARWDTSGWSPLGSGMSGSVLSLAVFDDGGGEALFAGGYFQSAGGLAADFIARWNGAEWSPVAGGTNAGVAALQVFDDGGGDALYAGGRFTQAGETSASRVAKWDGGAWSALGSGVDDCQGQPNDCVTALAVYPGAFGDALHAGGRFLTAGGETAGFIARWGCRSAVAVDGTPTPWTPIRVVAHPNPFSSRTVIRLTGADAAPRSAVILDASGRRVRTLPVSGSPARGTQELRWDGTNASGHALPSGVYFVRVSWPGRTQSARFVHAR